MKTCWVITNGTAGTVSQALGLAQAIGFKKIVQKVFKAWFSFSMIPSIADKYLDKFLTSNSDKLEGPWPDVIIGCGRRVIPFLLYIKKASGGKTYCIYVQDPRISPKYFDLIVKMQHDPIIGGNVIATNFSLNLIAKARLTKEVKQFGHLFDHLPKPYYTIVIGGDTKRYKMDQASLADLLYKVRSIVELSPGSALIATSRRTPEFAQEAILRYCKGNKKVYVTTPYSKAGNAYYAMLAAAEKIFVTNDSVNMISEACACGKPVYAIPLLNIYLGRTKKFLKTLSENNLIKIFDSRSIKEKNFGAKTNNNELIAATVRKKLLDDKVCFAKDFLL
jgi:mitochondrial fission protein ELM1